MDNANVLSTAQQRSLHSSRSAIQDVVTARSKPVDVVTIDASWWPTRVKQGVHVLNPSQDYLDYACDLSRRLGTYTVYAYRTHINK